MTTQEYKNQYRCCGSEICSLKVRDGDTSVSARLLKMKQDEWHNKLREDRKSKDNKNLPPSVIMTVKEDKVNDCKPTMSKEEYMKKHYEVMKKFNQIQDEYGLRNAIFI
jgi:hypothetical protein